MSSKNEIITPDNFNEVNEYLKNNYECKYMGHELKHGMATRYFESIEGFRTSMNVGTFKGERSHSVRASLMVKSNEERDFGHDRVEIYRTIFTLDELKELESKFTELNEFVKRLGLWNQQA